MKNETNQVLLKYRKLSSKYLITATIVFIGIFLILLPYNAYAQSTTTTTSNPTTTSSANPSPNPNSGIACGMSPQQSQGQIPPFCAKLIVTKQVDNSLGGTAVPSEFTLSVTGNNPSQSTFQGSSSGTTIVLAPGSYQVTEVSGPSNYVQVHHIPNRCDGGTISAGQTISCNILNRFVPPDNQGPEVLSFTVSPMRVSLSGGATITLTAHLTDQTGVELVRAFINDNCGGGLDFHQILPLPLVSGTPQDGIYEATFTFTQSAYDTLIYRCGSGLDAYFQARGLADDTLGHESELPLVAPIILTL